MTKAEVMNKFYQKLIIAFAATVVGMFGLTQTVFAVASLDVIFENTPLFSEANFLPGDAVERFVQVTNNSGTGLDIAVQSSNISDPNHLGDQIELIIKEGSTELFSGTLSDFFNSSENPDAKFLSPLPDGNSTQYDFFATFKPETGNAYQEDSLIFDLTFGSIGESGEPPGGGGVTIQSTGGSGGGGMPETIPGYTPPKNGQVNGINTSTPPAGLLAYTPPVVPAELPQGSSRTSSVGGAFVPAEEIGAVAAVDEIGEVLGDTTKEASTNVCSLSYWWWFIGYLVYLVLLFLAFWFERNRKSLWTYVLPAVLTVAALLWWWFEPCPSHFWIWPALIIVWLIGWSAWYVNQSGNNQQQLPFENKVDKQNIPPTDSSQS